MTSVGYVLFVVFVAMMAMFASSFNTPGSMWPSLVTVLSIITGSALIGSEFSTGTLQLIVSKPIRRSVYVVSRVAGVFVSIMLAAAIGLVAEAGMRVLGDPGTVPWPALAAAFTNALAVSLLAIALLTLLGSVTRAYFNVAIYFGVQIALSATEALLGLVRTRGRDLAVFLQQHQEIERGVVVMTDTLFPAMPSDLSVRWLLRVAATAVAALVLACLAFQRREVPYAAD